MFQCRLQHGRGNLLLAEGSLFPQFCQPVYPADFIGYEFIPQQIIGGHLKGIAYVYKDWEAWRFCAALDLSEICCIDMA